VFSLNQNLSPSLLTFPPLQVVGTRFLPNVSLFGDLFDTGSFVITIHGCWRRETISAARVGKYILAHPLRSADRDLAREPRHSRAGQHFVHSQQTLTYPSIPVRHFSRALLCIHFVGYIF